MTMTQSFSFNPSDGRKTFVSRPTDTAETANREQVACLTHIRPGTRPIYPKRAVERSEQGNVLVQLRFDRPDEPPAMTVLAAPKGYYLRSAVEDYAAGYRMPCLKDGPVEARQLFSFYVSGRSHIVPKDVGLLAFVRGAKSVPRPVQFDLDQMGCPFDVRVTFMQPADSNEVVELDNTDPRRLDFLDWLAAMRLDVDATTANALLGQSMTVSVPCGKVEL